jgi:hypothetical protein
VYLFSGGEGPFTWPLEKHGKARKLRENPVPEISGRKFIIGSHCTERNEYCILPEREMVSREF